MRKKIFNMGKELSIILIMLTALGCGSYGMFYTLFHGWINIILFIISGASFAFSMFILYTLSNQSK
jgi:hypothetical protein